MSKPSTPLIVELVGLPGAGKSTLAARAAHELRLMGLDCMERQAQQALVGNAHRQWPAPLRWARFAAWLTATQSQWLAEAMGFAAHLQPRDARGWRRLWYLTRNLHNADIHARHIARTGLAPDILLLDQDLVQEVWSVLYLREAFDEERARRLMAGMVPHLARLVIVLDLPARLSLERMAERRAQVGPTGEIDALVGLGEDALEASRRAMLSLADLLERAQLAQILRLDARQSSQEMCQTIVPRIAHALRCPTS